MKSRCTVGLLLFANLGWFATGANAQSAGSPSLFPLPPVVRTADSRAVNYNSYYAEPAGTPTPAAVPPEQFDSAFHNRTSAVDPPDEASKNAPPAGVQPAMPSAQTEYEQALHDTCWDDADASGCEACRCGGSGWFGAVGGIVMTRARGEKFNTSYQGTTDDPLMSTQDASAGWAGGAEVTLGYAFGGSNNMGPYGASGVCGQPGIAFTWWGTGNMTGFASIADETGVAGTAIDASFDFSSLTINGNPSSFYFQDASEQALWRTDVANNFEINLLAGSILNTGNLEMIGVLGFRYFRFTEDLIFGSTTFGSTFETNGGADSAFVNFHCVNNLYGPQIGSVFNMNFTDKWSIYLVPKMGIYGNQMILRSSVYTGDGVTAYALSQRQSDFSTLGSLDAGMTYAFRPNLRWYLGYRVVGVSNLVMGETQFTPSVGEIKNSSSLILHGGNVGLAWMY